MKNKDKYQTFDALKEAFRIFCKRHSNSVGRCQEGFGYCPPVATCILCYEMWKDSDTDIEEAEAKDKFDAEEDELMASVEFEEKYPGIIYDAGEILDPAKKLDTYMYFSNRLAYVLERMKIETLGDFMGLTRDRLSVQWGAGKVVLKEFDTAVDSLARYKADIENGKLAKEAKMGGVA